MLEVKNEKKIRCGICGKPLSEKRVLKLQAEGKKGMKCERCEQILADIRREREEVENATKSGLSTADV